MKNKILLVVLFFTLIISKSHAQQINIDVRVSPPYQLSLDGLTNQLLATVRNTSLETPANNINFKLELYGPKGLRIFSNRVFDEDIDLEPGEVRQFIGNDWDALYESTSLTIEPFQEKQRMLDTQSLRDGSYKICITAFSTITNERLSKGVPSDCADFTVEVPDAPKIIFPRSNYTIPQDGSPFIITWQQLNLKTSPTYIVEIVDISNFPTAYNPISEAFDHAEKVYQNDDASNFQEIVEDVDWEKGHEYAIRVTSRFGRNEGLLYRFRIHSKLVFIRYEGNAIADDDKDVKDPPKDDDKENDKIDEKGEAIVDVKDRDVKPHYPMANDTIPFLEFPLVVEFSPKNDSIKRMEFTASFKNKTDKSEKLKWKDGAKVFLEKRFSNATWQQASLIPLLDVTNSDKLKRGEQYHWSGNFSLFNKPTKGSEYPFTIAQQKFVIGMPKSQLKSPVKNAKVLAGDIEFKWKSAQKQQGRILPDYKLVHINKKGVLETRISNVNEHWVLQVFNKEKSTKKEDRVQQYHKKLTVNIDELYNKATRKFDIAKIEEKLYADMNYTFTITEKGNYWWRIVWLKNPDMTDAEIENIVDKNIYHATSLSPFSIGKDEAIADNSPETDDDCKSNCVIPTPSKNGNITLKVGNKTKIGKFNLTVKTISKSKNNKYTGTGLIDIYFLNNIKVKVDFTDIKINAQNQIYAGDVKAKKDREFITRDDKAVEGLEMIGMSKADAKSLDDAISDASKSVYEIASGSETTLPLGWDFEIDGHRIRLAIMNIDFKPTTATLNSMALVDIPIVSDDGSKFKETLSFGAKDMCFNPGGLGDDIRLYVPEDIELNPTDQNIFAIRGYTEARKDLTRTDKDYTYLKWSCDGFKELNIALQLKFSRDVILPEDKKGKPEKTGNVFGITNFNLKREDKKFNYLAEIKFSSPFQLPDENAYGWGFEVSHVWLDLSTVDNPPNIKFPKDYQFDTNDNRLANTWKGLWIDKIALKAPHFIETAQNDKKKIEIQASNFIIDPKISFSLEVKNFVPLSDKAKVDGSHISIDTIAMDVVQNRFIKAGFTGRIALPIAEDKPSQMFKYNVLMDNTKSKESSTNLGLVLSAKPAKDDIEIISKGFMMKGKIAKTSFIELGLRDKFYTKFKLDGTFGFSTEFDEKKQDRAFTLEMLGVTIEGLEYDSNKSEPFKCDDCFKTGLASPQKTISGFPLTLKSINMSSANGNPVLTIEPEIKLMGEDAGFDISTKIDITAKLAKVNGSWDFSIEDAEVKKITLEEGTNLGGVKVSGFLEFYKDDTKKGTKGALTVLLPGDIGGMMSADFGVVKQKGAKPSDYDKNKKWYSYWYVDGTVLFGSTGVPMGAVSLYGLGGGASYHMTQSSLPKGTALASSVSKQNKSPDENTVTSSGSKYEPDFDTGLGIKFTSILGSPGGGKVYNFDVTLSGEFNNNGGLHKLGLEGNARILANDENPFTGKAPMQAYVNFGMENFEDKEKLLITGNLVVSLDMLNGTLKGIGKASNRVPSTYTGPKNNILVEAAFMSDNEKDQWYFVMGKPQEKERAGISIGVTIGGKRREIAKTTGYFLAGNALDLIGVDLGMPSPTEAFLKIQARAQGNENFRGNSELKKDNRIASAVTNVKSIQGFQFGAALDVNFDAKVMPFYFDLGLAIGFDLLMKNVEQCAGTKTNKVYTPPGNDGWYTEGQFYAGIYGEFGLFVDLYFISGKFSIFDAAAALMLQGNFPNPDGFRGEGDISYNILGGMIEGNHHFEIETGEQCAAYTDPSDALDNLNIIGDLKPSGGNDTSVFATCAASFNIKLNRRLEIPISANEIKIVKPYLKSWKLKEKNGVNVAGNIRMKNDNFAAVLERDKMLKGNKTYTQTIRVMANEIVNGIEIPIKNKEKTANWFNERKETFKTGTSPDVIDEGNVNYTYPLKNQKHFLKKETQSNMGYVILNQAQNQDKKVFDRSTGRDFIARFIKIDGSNSIRETPIRLRNNDRTVAFDVSKLENNQVYLVQLLSKKKTASQSADAKDFSNKINSVRITEFSNDVPLPQVIKLTESNVNLLSNGSTFNVKEQKLPDDLVFDPSEKILYKYYFKTSKYNAFKEKMAGVHWSNTFNASSSVRGEYFTFNSTWAELPEAYDQTSTTLNKLKVESLIEVTINKDKRSYSYPENNYLKHVAKTYLKVPFGKIIGKINGYGLPFNYSNYKRKDYSEGVYFTQGSLFDTALTQGETQDAFETQQRNMETLEKAFADGQEQIDQANNSNNGFATFPSTDQNSTSTNNTSASAGTGGYQYTSVFIKTDVVSTPQIQIRHRLPVIATNNLRQMKKVLVPTIHSPIKLWNKSGANCYSILNSGKSSHYSSMYKKKYQNKKPLYKYIIDQPYSIGFLREFDKNTLKKIETLKKSYKLLRYSKNKRQQSFILQYQYPVPTDKVYNKAFMKQGTHVRITN